MQASDGINHIMGTRAIKWKLQMHSLGHCQKWQNFQTNGLLNTDGTLNDGHQGRDKNLIPMHDIDIFVNIFHNRCVKLNCVILVNSCTRPATFYGITLIRLHPRRS